MADSLKESDTIMTLTTWAWVLNYDQILTGRDQGCFPELGAEVNANNLTGSESDQEEK